MIYHSYSNVRSPKGSFIARPCSTLLPLLLFMLAFTLIWNEWLFSSVKVTSDPLEHNENALLVQDNPNTFDQLVQTDYIISTSSKDQPDKLLLASMIDERYCSGPCRFVNMLHIQEQETRSQMHLRDFAFTSGLINRTIVLPNVGGSRLGACLPYDFEYYYDIEWAHANRDHFNFITMRDFKAWIQERALVGVPVSDQVMSIYNARTTPFPRPAVISHCFDNMGTAPQSVFDQVFAWEDVKSAGLVAVTGESDIIKFLKGNPILDEDNITKLKYENDDVEVLHVRLTVSNPFSHNENACVPIPYSPKLVQLADQTAAQLGPFIAVHWRMETVEKTGSLLNCSISLINLLHAATADNANTDKQDRPLPVFLLTDYPHSFTQEQHDRAIKQQATEAELDEWMHPVSDTFKTLNSDHHRAVQYLYKHYPFRLFETEMDSNNENTINSMKRNRDNRILLKNWKTLRVPQEFKKADLTGYSGKQESNRMDHGWLGILDKLVAVRSTLFFAGRGGVCARGKSTFTKQIVRERAALLKNHNSRPLQYFG